LLDTIAGIGRSPQELAASGMAWRGASGSLVTNVVELPPLPDFRLDDEPNEPATAAHAEDHQSSHATDVSADDLARYNQIQAEAIAYSDDDMPSLQSVSDDDHHEWYTPEYDSSDDDADPAHPEMILTERAAIADLRRHISNTLRSSSTPVPRNADAEVAASNAAQAPRSLSSETLTRPPWSARFRLSVEGREVPANGGVEVSEGIHPHRGRHLGDSQEPPLGSSPLLRDDASVLRESEQAIRDADALTELAAQVLGVNRADGGTT
jgi:hypothetical protein